MNGKWGSGKTYFWENELKGAIENFEINEKKQKTIYVSLYGITSIDEINKRIVVDNLLKKSKNIQKLVSDKLGGKITELAKMSIGIVKNFEIPVLKQVLETEVNYENFLDFTDTVLCFDDLERANIEITEILGYINNFVEHDGAKVIIIGNENEISDKLISRNLELKMLVSSMILDKEDGLKIKQVNNKDTEYLSLNNVLSDKVISLFGKSNEYKRIKEKLIGKTLTIIPDYPSLIGDIINKVSDEPLKEFLNKNLDLIIGIFKESCTENIRILKQGLDDFALIYGRYQAKYSHLGDEVLSSILIYTLATSFEIKSGAENNEELTDVSNDVLLGLSFSRAFNSNNKKSYIELFKERYFGNFYIKNGLFFFKFTELLVRKGIFNSEVFTQEMEDIEAKTGETTPLYLRFIRDGYWELSDDEFIEVEKQAYQKLVNGEIHFVLYFRAFTLYRYLIEKGLVQKTVKDIKEEFLKGIELAAEKAEYYPNMDTHFIGTVLVEEDIDALEFKENLFEINRGLSNKQEEKQIKESMAYMTTDFLKFLEDMRERYFYVPIFFKYNAEELFEKVLSLTNPHTSVFTGLLEKRYKSKDDVRNYKLYLDKDNLNSLKNKIDEYLDGKNITQKLSFLKELSETIKMVTSELEQLEPKVEEGEIKNIEAVINNN